MRFLKLFSKARVKRQQISNILNNQILLLILICNEVLIFKNDHISSTRSSAYAQVVRKPKKAICSFLLELIFRLNVLSRWCKTNLILGNFSFLSWQVRSLVLLYPWGRAFCSFFRLLSKVNKKVWYTDSLWF